MNSFPAAPLLPRLAPCAPAIIATVLITPQIAYHSVDFNCADKKTHYTQSLFNHISSFSLPPPYLTGSCYIHTCFVPFSVLVI